MTHQRTIATITRVFQEGKEMDLSLEEVEVLLLEELEEEGDEYDEFLV